MQDPRARLLEFHTKAFPEGNLTEGASSFYPKLPGTEGVLKRCLHYSFVAVNVQLLHTTYYYMYMYMYMYIHMGLYDCTFGKGRK